MGAIRHAARRGLAIVALALLSGGCALAGRSVGQYADDARLTGKVKMSLAAQHLSHVRRVNVDVHEGVVYLSGTVDSAVEKSDAEIRAWKIEGVQQVVNDLVVRGPEREGAPAALPRLSMPHPVLARFPWVTRVERQRAGGPEFAYDAGGRLVATVHTLSSRQLIDAGFTTLPADGRPVDHVSVHAIPVRADLPDPQYAVVLWHVRAPDAER